MAKSSQTDIGITERSDYDTRYDTPSPSIIDAPSDAFDMPYVMINGERFPNERASALLSEQGFSLDIFCNEVWSGMKLEILEFSKDRDVYGETAPVKFKVTFGEKTLLFNGAYYKSSVSGEYVADYIAGEYGEVNARYKRGLYLTSNQSVLSFMELLSIPCVFYDDNHIELSEPVNTVKVISPDGKFAVCSSIQENLEDENGQYYSIYDVQLSDNINNTMICTFHIVGRDFRFLWSPDSKYVAATYSGRIWTDFSILDVRRHSVVSVSGISEILDSFKNMGEKFDYEINLDRPDPYVSPIEWSPDGTCILISYQVRDTVNQTQSGVFVYNFTNETFSNLLQLPPSEADHVEVIKPENFNWI